MSDFNAASIDRLMRYGILDKESKPTHGVDSLIPQTVSTPNQRELQNDEYTSLTSDVFPINSKIKTYGAIGLLTYILGVITSKGKLNPIDGLKGLFGVAKSLLLGFCKIFKKS